jgi:hypothetical protein
LILADFLKNKHQLSLQLSSILTHTSTHDDPSLKSSASLLLAPNCPSSGIKIEHPYYDFRVLGRDRSVDGGSIRVKSDR